MTRKAFIRCTPESVGIPSEAILNLLDVLENGGFTEMHGLMIMRHDKICAEGWWSPYAPDRHHLLHSLSKTWTATAIGLAEYAGLLRLTDRVCDILPEVMPDPMPERVGRVTVRDLLMMASGSETEDNSYPADWKESFFDRSFEHEPGTFWRYNSHGTAMLSAIVEKVSGTDMLTFLRQRLMDKIGVDADNVLCYRGDDGTCLGGHGMFTTTEDNLRLMRLYLKGGVWDGERLLSEEFARDATSPLISNSEAHAHTPWIYDNRCGYGYQIWMCRPAGSYRADGAFGQFCVVVPSLDLIVSINEAAILPRSMSHNELRALSGKEAAAHPVHGPQQTLNALFDILLPAMTADGSALPENEASARLATRLGKLSVPLSNAAPLCPARDLSLTLRCEDGGIDFCAAHSMAKHRVFHEGAERILLACKEDRLTLRFVQAGHEQTICADLRGGLTLGRLSFADQGEIITEIAASAHWEKENELVLSLRWIETETVNQFAFRIGEHRVHICKTEGLCLVGDPLMCEAEYLIV